MGSSTVSIRVGTTYLQIQRGTRVLLDVSSTDFDPDEHVTARVMDPTVTRDPHGLLDDVVIRYDDSPEGRDDTGWPVSWFRQVFVNGHWYAVEGVNVEDGKAYLHYDPATPVPGQTPASDDPDLPEAFPMAGRVLLEAEAETPVTLQAGDVVQINVHGFNPTRYRLRGDPTVQKVRLGAGGRRQPATDALLVQGNWAWSKRDSSDPGGAKELHFYPGGDTELVLYRNGQEPQLIRVNDECTGFVIVGSAAAPEVEDLPEAEAFTNSHDQWIDIQVGDHLIFTNRSGQEDDFRRVVTKIEPYDHDPMNDTIWYRGRGKLQQLSRDDLACNWVAAVLRDGKRYDVECVTFRREGNLGPQERLRVVQSEADGVDLPESTEEWKPGVPAPDELYPNFLVKTVGEYELRVTEEPMTELSKATRRNDLPRWTWGIGRARRFDWDDLFGSQPAKSKEDAMAQAEHFLPIVMKHQQKLKDEAAGDVEPGTDLPESADQVQIVIKPGMRWRENNEGLRPGVDGEQGDVWTVSSVGGPGLDADEFESTTSGSQGAIHYVGHIGEVEHEGVWRPVVNVGNGRVLVLGPSEYEGVDLPESEDGWQMQWKRKGYKYELYATQKAFQGLFLLVTCTERTVSYDRNIEKMVKCFEWTVLPVPLRDLVDEEDLVSGEAKTEQEAKVQAEAGALQYLKENPPEELDLPEALLAEEVDPEAVQTVKGLITQSGLETTITDPVLQALDHGDYQGAVRAWARTGVNSPLNWAIVLNRLMALERDAQPPQPVAPRPARPRQQNAKLKPAPSGVRWLVRCTWEQGDNLYSGFAVYFPRLKKAVLVAYSFTGLGVDDNWAAEGYSRLRDPWRDVFFPKDKVSMEEAEDECGTWWPRVQALIDQVTSPNARVEALRVDQEDQQDLYGDTDLPESKLKEALVDLALQVGDKVQINMANNPWDWYVHEIGLSSGKMGKEGEPAVWLGKARQGKGSKYVPPPDKRQDENFSLELMPHMIWRIFRDGEWFQVNLTNDGPKIGEHGELIYRCYSVGPEHEDDGEELPEAIQEGKPTPTHLDMKTLETHEIGFDDPECAADLELAMGRGGYYAYLHVDFEHGDGVLLDWAGPYDSRGAAGMAGLTAAWDWAHDNLTAVLANDDADLTTDFQADIDDRTAAPDLPESTQPDVYQLKVGDRLRMRDEDEGGDDIGVLTVTQVDAAPRASYYGYSVETVNSSGQKNVCELFYFTDVEVNGQWRHIAKPMAGGQVELMPDEVEGVDLPESAHGWQEYMGDRWVLLKAGLVARVWEADPEHQEWSLGRRLPIKPEESWRWALCQGQDIRGRATYEEPDELLSKGAAPSQAQAMQDAQAALETEVGARRSAEPDLPESTAPMPTGWRRMNAPGMADGNPLWRKQVGNWFCFVGGTMDGGKRFYSAWASQIDDPDEQDCHVFQLTSYPQHLAAHAEQWALDHSEAAPEEDLPESLADSLLEEEGVGTPIVPQAGDLVDFSPVGRARVLDVQRLTDDEPLNIHSLLIRFDGEVKEITRMSNVKIKEPFWCDSHDLWRVYRMIRGGNVLKVDVKHAPGYGDYPMPRGEVRFFVQPQADEEGTDLPEADGYTSIWLKPGTRVRFSLAHPSPDDDPLDDNVARVTEVSMEGEVGLRMEEGHRLGVHVSSLTAFEKGGQWYGITGKKLYLDQDPGWTPWVIGGRPLATEEQDVDLPESEEPLVSGHLQLEAVWFDLNDERYQNYGRGEAPDVETVLAEQPEIWTELRRAIKQFPRVRYSPDTVEYHDEVDGHWQCSVGGTIIGPAADLIKLHELGGDEKWHVSDGNGNTPDDPEWTNFDLADQPEDLPESTGEHRPAVTLPKGTRMRWEGYGGHLHGRLTQDAAVLGNILAQPDGTSSDWETWSWQVMSKPEVWVDDRWWELTSWAGHEYKLALWPVEHEEADTDLPESVIFGAPFKGNPNWRDSALPPVLEQQISANRAEWGAGTLTGRVYARQGGNGLIAYVWEEDDHQFSFYLWAVVQGEKIVAKDEEMDAPQPEDAMWAAEEYLEQQEVDLPESTSNPAADGWRRRPSKVKPVWQKRIGRVWCFIVLEGEDEFWCSTAWDVDCEDWIERSNRQRTWEEAVAACEKIAARVQNPGDSFYRPPTDEDEIDLPESQGEVPVVVGMRVQTANDFEPWVRVVDQKVETSFSWPRKETIRIEIPGGVQVPWDVAQITGYELNGATYQVTQRRVQDGQLYLTGTVEQEALDLPESHDWVYLHDRTTPNNEECGSHAEQVKRLCHSFEVMQQLGAWKIVLSYMPYTEGGPDDYSIALIGQIAKPVLAQARKTFQGDHHAGGMESFDMVMAFTKGRNTFTAWGACNNMWNNPNNVDATSVQQVRDSLLSIISQQKVAHADDMDLPEAGTPALADQLLEAEGVPLTIKKGESVRFTYTPPLGWGNNSFSGVGRADMDTDQAFQFSWFCMEIGLAHGRHRFAQTSHDGEGLITKGYRAFVVRDGQTLEVKLSPDTWTLVGVPGGSTISHGPEVEDLPENWNFETSHPVQLERGMRVRVLYDPFGQWDGPERHEAIQLLGTVVVPCEHTPWDYQAKVKIDEPDEHDLGAAHFSPKELLAVMYQGKWRAIRKACEAAAQIYVWLGDQEAAPGEGELEELPEGTKLADTLLD